jgi:hypothetical protein
MPGLRLLAICTTLCVLGGLSSAAGGKRLQPHVVVLRVDTQGIASLGVMKYADIASEQRRLALQYSTEVSMWRKENSKRGGFRAPAPARPQLRVLTKRLAGSEKADEELKKLQAHYKRFLEKANAKAKARRALPSGGNGGSGHEHGAPVELITNGGFEKMVERSLVPFGWAKDGGCHKTDGVSYVRASRANPHGGERTLSLRLVSESGRAGITSSIELDVGKYTVSFWACCDVEAKALLNGSLGRTELKGRVLGEEYVKFTETVTVTKRNKKGAVKFWTTTPRVRVYIDDVSVRRQQ